MQTRATSTWSSGSLQCGAFGLELVFLDPGLGGHLHGIPRRSEGRGVGKVELGHARNGHVVEERGGVRVDSLGDLGALGADELRTEEPPGICVTRDSDRDRCRTRVVGLVVIRDRGCTDGLEPRSSGFVLPQAGAGGDEVEDLDDLGAELAGVLHRSAKRVLGRDAALLVGGGA